MTTTLEKPTTLNTTAPLDMDVPLTDAERDRLERCEAVIREGITIFWKVGTALTNIRDSRLYRQTHRTFEDYCEQTFDIKRSSAYRLIGAVEVLDNIAAASPIGDKTIGDTLILPANEAQARPLAALPPDQQPVAWARDQEIAGDVPITAAIVQEAVDEIRPPAPTPVAKPSAEEMTIFGDDDIPASIRLAAPCPLPASQLADVATLTADGDAHTSPPTPAPKPLPVAASTPQSATVAAPAKPSARASAPSAAPTRPAVAPVASDGPATVTCMITQTDDDWLWENDLTITQALGELRAWRQTPAFVTLTPLAARALSFLTEKHNAAWSDGEPVTQEERLEAILAVRAEQNGMALNLTQTSITQTSITQTSTDAETTDTDTLKTETETY